MYGYSLSLQYDEHLADSLLHVAANVAFAMSTAVNIPTAETPSPDQEGSGTPLGTLSVLPREIRDEIYDHLFNADETVVVISACCNHSTGTIEFTRNTSHGTSEHVYQCIFNPSVATGCVRGEMLPRFYENVRVQIRLRTEGELEEDTLRGHNILPVHDFPYVILPKINSLEICMILHMQKDVKWINMDGEKRSIVQRFHLDILPGGGEARDLRWAQSILGEDHSVGLCTGGVRAQADWIESFLAAADWFKSRITPAMLAVLLFKISSVDTYQIWNAPYSIKHYWRNKVHPERIGWQITNNMWILPPVVHLHMIRTKRSYFRLPPHSIGVEPELTRNVVQSADEIKEGGGEVETEAIEHILEEPNEAELIHKTPEIKIIIEDTQEEIKAEPHATEPGEQATDHETPQTTTDDPLLSMTLVRIAVVLLSGLGAIMVYGEGVVIGLALAALLIYGRGAAV